MYHRRVRRSVLIGGILVIAALIALLVRESSTKSRASRTASGTSRHGDHRAAKTSDVPDGPVRRVAGTVYLDDTGAAGATVRLAATHSALERTVKTDTHGGFDFGPVPFDRYHVIADVARGTGVAIAIDLHDRLVEVDKLRLVAHACEASLHGVIRYASGGTIAKARVIATGTLQDGPSTEASDEGAYELCVPVGQSMVMVRADGYADTYVAVSAFGRLRRDVQLVPEAIVAGRAVRAADGSPVRRWRPSRWEDPARRSSSRSNEMESH